MLYQQSNKVNHEQIHTFSRKHNRHYHYYCIVKYLAFQCNLLLQSLIKINTDFAIEKSKLSYLITFLLKHDKISELPRKC